MRHLLVSSALLISLVLAAGGCNDECTDEARAGLRVVVTDADSGERLCDATVTAIDGPYSELLFAYGAPNCSYSGVFERTGDYLVEVKQTGYVTAESAAITVAADNCHVILQDVSVPLELAP